MLNNNELDNIDCIIIVFNNIYLNLNDDKTEYFFIFRFCF